MTTVAVLGTGIMGEPIARNLTKGFGVRVWNRTRDKAQRLAGVGATVCDTPREAATGADLVYTMLTDADATAVLRDHDVTDALTS
jgi:3-hydroxyisobutyrate dehydrogenase